MGHINGRFADQNPYVLSGQVQTSNNNQTVLNASIAETDQIRGSAVINQPTGLLANPTNDIPNVATTTQGTIGAALGDIGQGGTPSQTPGGGGNPCPTLSQYIMVRSDVNTPIPTLVRYVTVGMSLWNPISGEFEPLVTADEVPDQEIWALISGIGGAEGSASHPLIQHHDDTKGTALSKCIAPSCVPVLNGTIQLSRQCRTRNQSFRATVKRLETAGPGHIYAAGDSPDAMFCFHNLKPLDGGF